MTKPATASHVSPARFVLPAKLLYCALPGLAVPIYLCSILPPLMRDTVYWLQAGNANLSLTALSRITVIALCALLLVVSALMLICRQRYALPLIRAALQWAMLTPFLTQAAIPFVFAGSPAELFTAFTAGVWLTPVLFYAFLVYFSNAPAIRAAYPVPAPFLAWHRIFAWYYCVWCLLYVVGMYTYIRLMLWPQYVSVGQYEATGTVWTSILMVLATVHGLGALASFFALVTHARAAVPLTQGILTLQICSMALVMVSAEASTTMEQALAFEDPPWILLLIPCLFLGYFLLAGRKRRP